MKIHPPTALWLALSVIALAAAACFDPAPRIAATKTGASQAKPASTTGLVVPRASAPPPVAFAAAADWSDIQGLGYDDRTDFKVGLGRLYSRLDERIAGLKLRRDALAGDRNPTAGGAALEVLGTARTRLRSASTDMAKADPENWNQRRERFADAWANIPNTLDKADDAVPR